jgi:lysophospholipase L1-like esterase
MIGNSRMTRAGFRKLPVAMSIVLITLVALEVTVRIWGYAERHIYDPIYMPFDRTGDIPYVHKPNLTEARARGLAVINTDSLGLRAKMAGASYGPKQPNEYRIALVGDSCTFGEGVARTEDTFAQVLEDTLNRRQRAMTVKVLNFGASAYSVKQMVVTLQYRMLDLQPDLVVMAIITSDFNLARTPTVDAEGYLVDQNVPRWSSSGSMLRQVLRKIHLMHVLREVVVRRFYSSPDIAKVFSQGEIPETYEYVRQFKKVAEERGFPYVVLLLPRVQVQPNPWGPMPDRLVHDAVTHLDVSPIRQEFTEEQYMSSRFDPHPSAAVHRRIGEALADYVQHQPGFAR